MNQSLSGRTILLAARDALTREMAVEIESYGARVLECPPVEIAEPDDYALLDEAIENLFGYHWLILSNVNSAGCFMRRFRHLGHEVSELDALRICAVDEATARALEQSQVHVDVIPPARITESAFGAIHEYAGGPESLRGLNFLFPRAAISRDLLPQALEDAGARVDALPAYRTVAAHNSALAQLNALLTGGGIDCVVFISPFSVESFAELFDTNDLASLLRDVRVVCLDQSTTGAAIAYGSRTDLEPGEATANALAREISDLLS